MQDDLQKVIDRYGNLSFGDLNAIQQSEYLGALAKRGAKEALNEIGLSDDNAAADIKDVRDLLRGFRIVRSRAWSTAIDALGRLLGWIALICLVSIVVRSDTVKALLERAMK